MRIQFYIFLVILSLKLNDQLFPVYKSLRAIYRESDGVEISHSALNFNPPLENSHFSSLKTRDWLVEGGEETNSPSRQSSHRQVAGPGAFVSRHRVKTSAKSPAFRPSWVKTSSKKIIDVSQVSLTLRTRFMFHSCQLFMFMVVLAFNFLSGLTRFRLICISDGMKH